MARRGFSLLEMVLALAVLAGAVLVLLEVNRVALRNAARARDLARAQLLCESKLAEIVSGITSPSPVDKASFDPNVESSVASDPSWSYSIDTPPTDEQGLIAVRVTVAKELSAGQQPLKFSLVRWMPDPNSSSGANSTSGGTASSANTGGGNGL